MGLLAFWVGTGNRWKNGYLPPNRFSASKRVAKPLLIADNGREGSLAASGSHWRHTAVIEVSNRQLAPNSSPSIDWLRKKSRSPNRFKVSSMVRVPLVVLISGSSRNASHFIGLSLD